MLQNYSELFQNESYALRQIMTIPSHFWTNCTPLYLKCRTPKAKNKKGYTLNLRIWRFLAYFCLSTQTV